MVKEEGRNLQKRVLRAGGEEEMDGDPLKRLIEAENAVKSDQAIGCLPHFTNAIQKEAKVIYPSKNWRIIG